MEHGKACAQCGAQFTAVHGRSKYCSNRCRNKAGHSRRKTFGLSCADCGKGMQKTPTSRPQGEARCNECRRARPTEPQHGTANRYKSNGCRCPDCTEAVRVDAKKYRDSFLRKNGHGYYAGRKRNRKRKQYERTCDYCGTQYTTRNHRTMYCSATCGIRDRNGWSRSKELTVYIPPPKPRETAPPTTTIASRYYFTSGRCRVCQQWFTSEYMNVTCSPECQRQYKREQKYRARHKRRARKRDAYRADVWRKKIFERDGYRCHICGRKTNRNKTAPYPTAPTLDHIIPLAKGGTHEPSNVGTAHFKCNSRKTHVGTGDQLMLFG